MRKKKICFIAQFPPPIHGLSKAVETLYNSNLTEEFEFMKVDITKNKRLVGNLKAIWKSKADLFYFTLSQTKFGNIRDLIILKLLRLKKKNCLIHLHGGYYRKLVDNDMLGWQRKMNYTAIKNLAGVIVLSPSLKYIFQGMIEEEKIFVVPNCVDDEFLISDADFEEKMNGIEHKEVLHVLYLSNFIRSKGYLTVLEIAKLEKELIATGAKKWLHFNFAGSFFENTEREIFENYIYENKLEEIITYHGIVSGQRKKDLLKHCEISILPTRYPNEGQPISILEAMGNGMVIITTDHAGIPDIVVNDVNGIVASLNFDQAEHLYKSLYGIQKRIKQIARENRTKCFANYRENRYIDNLKDVFKNISI